MNDCYGDDAEDFDRLPKGVEWVSPKADRHELLLSGRSGVNHGQKSNGY
jgi:hypothetical protein